MCMHFARYCEHMNILRCEVLMKYTFSIFIAVLHYVYVCHLRFVVNV